MSDPFTRPARAFNREITHYMTRETNRNIHFALKSSADLLKILRDRVDSEDRQVLDSAIKRNKDAMKLLE